MGVEISEASQDGPYLFQALLYGENLQKKTRTWTHMVTARGFSELMPFTNTSSGNRIGWYIGRVDNWTGRWDNIAKAIDSSKNIVLYNATVGNKEDIIEYGAYLIVSASSVHQLRQRRQVVLNYFDDMGVEISEASQDGPYLFQALLYGDCLLYTSPSPRD